jgi:hypothetical protein
MTTRVKVSNPSQRSYLLVFINRTKSSLWRGTQNQRLRTSLSREKTQRVSYSGLSLEEGSSALLGNSGNHLSNYELL